MMMMMVTQRSFDIVKDNSKVNTLSSLYFTLESDGFE